MARALDRTNALTNSGVPMGTPTHFSPVTVMMPRVQQDPPDRGLRGGGSSSSSSNVYYMHGRDVNGGHCVSPGGLQAYSLPQP
jgi:hypothetical protein